MKLNWKVITVVYLILLTYVSLKPAPADEVPGMQLREAVHNLCHIPAYSLLTYCFFQSLKGNARIYGIAFILTMAYGILMEIGQSFVPNRYCSWGDVALNALGSVLMIVLLRRGFLNKGGLA